MTWLMNLEPQWSFYTTQKRALQAPGLIFIDDAFTEAKGAHARLLAQYLEDQAKLKSE